MIIGRLAIIAPLPISRLVVPLETSFGPVEIGLAIRTRERAKTRPDSADGPTPEGEVTRASAAQSGAAAGGGATAAGRA